MDYCRETAERGLPEDESLKEMQGVLKNNGWTYVEDEDEDPFFARDYPIEGRPLLESGDWRQAITAFHESQGIPEGLGRITANREESNIWVMVYCKPAREQLLQMLALDQHLRMWGFEERSMTLRLSPDTAKESVA